MQKYKQEMELLQMRLDYLMSLNDPDYEEFVAEIREIHKMVRSPELLIMHIKKIYNAKS